MNRSLANGEAVMDYRAEQSMDLSLPQANPNRQRPRVTRACDNCKTRKMRCTGKLPCAHCVKMGKSCEYKAKYTRGAAPNIETAPHEDQVKYLEKYDWPAGNAPRRPISPHTSSIRSLSEQAPDVSEKVIEPFSPEMRGKELAERARKVQRTAKPYSETTFSLQEPDNSNDSERDTVVNPFAFQEDPSSGASFFERTEKKMAQLYNQQKTPVHMFGDPPIPEIDTSFFVLPTPELGRAMVQKFFTECSGLTRFLHAQTVEGWTTRLLNSFGSINRDTDGNGERAVVLMVFASAHEGMFGGSERSDTDLSFHYFHAAENQLKNETGEVNLATIQARLLQCMYLLSRSRVNQTCSIFSAMVNMIFVLGIHRKKQKLNSDDLVQLECAKRTFWQAYMLDKYLACSLGRPPMLRDEDIDQDLPKMVNDEDLLPATLITTSSSVQRGSVYHIKLSIIINKIVLNLCSARKPPVAKRFALAGELYKDAQAWHSEISHFINLELAPLSRVFQAQILGLRLAYQEMLVMLFRPFLLDDFEQQRYLDANGHDLNQQSKENVRYCLKAAISITETIHEMSQRPDKMRTSWFAHYCGYQAVVALYVYVIKNVRTDSKWTTYFKAASSCQDQIKVSAAKESFSQKSSGVLDELRIEALEHIKKSGNLIPAPSAARNVQKDGGFESQRAAGSATSAFLSSTSFFGGNWSVASETNFDRSAPGGGILSSLGGVSSSRRPKSSSSVIERIDAWGFSSLTGY